MLKLSKLLVAAPLSAASAASTAPACVWCGVTNALPWWVWVAAAIGVVVAVWLWNFQRSRKK